MTPDEHIARGDELLEASESSHREPEHAAAYAVRAQGHYQAASVKLSREMFRAAAPYLTQPEPVREPAESEGTCAG